MLCTFKTELVLLETDNVYRKVYFISSKSVSHFESLLGIKYSYGNALLFEEFKKFTMKVTPDC